MGRRPAKHPGGCSKRSGWNSRTLFDSKASTPPAAAPASMKYSRYLTGRSRRNADDAFEYVPDNALVFATKPRHPRCADRGMYRGDLRRKAKLAEYGFGPSAWTNRRCASRNGTRCGRSTVGSPQLPAGEINDGLRGVRRAGESARPAHRPPVEVRPARTKVDDMVGDVREIAARANASCSPCGPSDDEDLHQYMHEQGPRVRLHALRHRHHRRIEIIRDLRPAR